MTEKELKKLNRLELLEMLIAQGKKVERLEQELAAAKHELGQREIVVSNSGTLAEAALKLNRIFEDADNAAEQYLESIRAKQANADSIIMLAQQEAGKIIKSAEMRAKEILDDADREAHKRI